MYREDQVEENFIVILLQNQWVIQMMNSHQDLLKWPVSIHTRQVYQIKCPLLSLYVPIFFFTIKAFYRIYIRIQCTLGCQILGCSELIDRQHELYTLKKKEKKEGHYSIHVIQCASSVTGHTFTQISSDVFSVACLNGVFMNHFILEDSCTKQEFNHHAYFWHKEGTLPQHVRADFTWSH